MINIYIIWSKIGENHLQMLLKCAQWPIIKIQNGEFPSVAIKTMLNLHGCTKIPNLCDYKREDS